MVNALKNRFNIVGLRPETTVWLSVSCGFGLAGGASAVPENIEDSTRWRGASADKPHSHIELQSAAFHAAGAA
ncbi:hypothetical protein LWJ16_004298 [Escherichia coli]|nr:hypothetical protein [Escherichia coli]